MAINPDVYYSSHEVAAILRITPNALYMAVRGGKLSRQKIEGKQKYHGQEILRYLSTKWDRKRDNGTYIFTETSKLYSVKMATQRICKEVYWCSCNHVYFLIRSGYIEASKVGGMYTITEESLMSFIKNNTPKIQSKAV